MAKKKSYWESKTDEEILESVRHNDCGAEEIVTREAIARIFEKVVLGKR